MKKIYLALGFGLLILGANAQQKITKPLTANPVNKAILLNDGTVAKTAVTSTLTPPTFTAGGCATNTANIVYYSAFGSQATTQYTYTGVGYSFGTNSSTTTVPGIGDIIASQDKVAQKYNVTGFVSVTDVIVYSAIAQGTGIVSAKIYSEDGTTKGPLAQIGTTATKVLSSFTGLDVFTFGTPVALSAGNFFASIESPAIGGAGMDTLAILSTNVGCSSADSLSWIYTSSASPFVPNEWSSMEVALGGNLDLLIFPVIDITTGINNSISKGNLTLLAAFPNPANNEIAINFSLNQSSKVEIEIYDVTGKMVNTTKLDNLEAGNHTSKVNTSNLNAGVYMYSVKSDNAKMFSKFTIAK
ncbi:MAG: T9SS type A sorting domain-containing protein [Bacteroidia bacterium]|nr:T9SS type A sorting domain-containing protein [Bacteroidia bacterium]